MKAFYHVARALLVGGCYVLFRLKVRHRDLVPSSGPYVLVPTHRSIVDTFVAASVTRKRIRFMGKQELWANPVASWVLTALGGFPVDRAAGSGAVKAALGVLDGGESIVVFPEGTRRQGPRVEHLQQGAAYLAVKRGVPLVPVGIAGSEGILARGRAVPRLKKVAVVIGPPLHPGNGPVVPGRTPTPGRVVDRSEVARLTGALEEELQRLFDEGGRLLGER